MTQDEALAILKTGASVFLTGEPGSGKTHTVNRFVAYLRDNGIVAAITASTGIAATHIGGMTIHSWSGIGIKTELGKRDIDAIAQNRRVYDRVSSASTLIIDEVSMLRSATLSAVDAVCREVRRDTRPFGGLQVVLVGDFFQLPPVVRRDEDTPQAKLLPALADTALFAFHSPAWVALKPFVCYLSEQHRQSDAPFLELLSAIRTNTFAESHKALLRTRYAKEPKETVTRLYSHNEDVDRINDAELARLDAPLREYTMDSRGPEAIVAGLKRGCISPENLRLRLGARVMFTKNDHITNKYVNGTLGTVTGFVKETGVPIVTTHTGKTIFVEPAEWTVKDGDRVIAVIEQYPLRLAWAITVHKSQGMSLDAAHMDLSDVFEYGQGYVALSRVRTLAGLSLAGLNARAVETHPDIREQDSVFRADSDRSREAFANMPPAELAALHANFIRACGGKEIIAKEKREKKGKRKKGKIKPPKEPSWKKTATLAREGKTIEQIARELGFAQSTIFGHLEKARAEGALSVSVLQHLSRGKEKDVVEIQHAFDTIGADKLKPIFEHFNGRFSYETIRLARLLFVAKQH